MIEVMSNGALNIVIDHGRIDAMPLGVSIGGPMDKLAFDLANLMVGNAPEAAGIEVTIFPFRARVESDVLVAITGGSGNARVGERKLPPYWCHWVRAGETLVIEPPPDGARVYIAVAGGIDVPQVLGSRATNIRAGFGGLAGRGLQRGDRLPIGSEPIRPRKKAANGHGFGVAPALLKDFYTDLRAGVVTVRCLASAEFAHFTEAAKRAFGESLYTVSPESNRMGYRLSGQALELTAPMELLSYGILPGTIQVPPSGQPIIQLSDANTCGGYPKIANVIECDLWRLGQARPGTRLRFELLAPDAALAAMRSDHQALLALADNVELIAGRL
jgi:biotin-dependent carboxylase-like uncharacterized protein